MKCLLLAMGISILLLGCASAPQVTHLNHWRAISNLPLGASKDDLIKVLGNPSEEEVIEGTTTLTYAIPYKRLQIPKVIVWLSSDNKVIEKKINLFRQSSDDMDLSDVESRMGHLNLAKDSEPFHGHYISSTRTLTDAKNGVSVEARNSEILSVSWFESSRNPAQSR